MVKKTKKRVLAKSGKPKPKVKRVVKKKSAKGKPRPVKKVKPKVPPGFENLEKIAEKLNITVSELLKGI